MSRLLQFLLIGLLSLWPAFASGEDWPRWRGTRGDGTWNAPNLPAEWPKEGLPIIWKRSVGAGYSGISVAGGRAYTMDRPKSAQGEPEQERILCFDAGTGVPLWQHSYEAPYGKLDYGKGPRCTPTVHEGLVYTLGAVGHVHCLDAATGEVRWSHDLIRDQRAEQPLWGFAASPVIFQDLVIIHAGLKMGCYTAYDRLTGKEVWRSGNDPAGYATPILIRHAGTQQLVGWTPENIVGLRPTDGEIFWKIPYKVTYGVSIATPIFHEDIVLVCGYWEGSKAIKLGSEPTQAEILWEENRWLRGLMDQPLYRNGLVYLLDKQHGIVAFKLLTGEKIWTDDNRTTPRDRNPQVSLVWIADTDRALGLNARGELVQVRLTPQGLEEQGRTKIVGDTWAHPAYAGDYAFARDDEQLVCVSLK